MSFEEKKRQQLEQLISEASELIFEIQRQLGFALTPTEEGRLRLDLEKAQTHLKSLEDEYAPLKPAPPASSQPKAATTGQPSDLASLTPEFDTALERFAFAQKLLECEAMRDNQRRALVVSLLPAEIRHNIDSAGAINIQVVNIVETCDRYPNGLTRLLEAVPTIEGDTKAWNKLLTYLKARKYPDLFFGSR